MPEILKAVGLSKSYGSNLAVSNFDILVLEGEVVALLGASGSGKSTLLKMFCADLRPDSGAVAVCGYDTVLQAGMVRPRIGVVRHERFLEPGLTGRENLDEQAMLRFFTPEDAELRIGELLELIDLDKRIDDPLNTYAPDEWTRLEMAACLIHRPQLMLVDEPSRGTDAAGRERVWHALRRLRHQVKSLLYTTPDEAETHMIESRVVRI
jgi:ABC-type multidrug transport system ATPase subunit